MHAHVHTPDKHTHAPHKHAHTHTHPKPKATCFTDHTFDDEGDVVVESRNLDAFTLAQLTSIGLHLEIERPRPTEGDFDLELFSLLYLLVSNLLLQLGRHWGKAK